MSSSILEIRSLTRRLVVAHSAVVFCAVVTLCSFPSIVLVAFSDKEINTLRSIQVLITLLWIPAMPAFGFCVCRWWRATLRRRLIESNSESPLVSLT
jgi:hypothetical protein